ncbi:hypothetical protein SDC9_129721 [bioreactor metagenome]|uniref:Bifunctional glucose-6-phosphate/mannose-6-phosphate isomerase C-terminal domain-containing protein n=1 Tax=bioreactor metagenome TaxID=1076179 RepID=A0A645D0F6_9ZZZZ
MFYSFFHLIFVLSRQNIINSKDFSDAIDVIVANRYETKLDYSTINNNNLTIAIAKLITNKIPLIYSNQGNLEAVNLRWRAQIQENSNQMCFGNYYPELNHNEINGWSLPAELIDKFVVIAIKDEADSAELNETLTNSLELLKESNRNVIELTVEGEFLLDRMVKLICIADWVSFYLAIFNSVDPTPIPEIAKLKKRKEK